MPNFRYKALTQAGEIVTGEITAPTAAEVARRIEYLGLVPVDAVTEERPAATASFFTLGKRAKGEDVTVFTLDLALLLKAGASAPSAISHFAFGSTPVSSSKVESSTPVHSEQEAKPCNACTLAWIGSFEKSGALLPPHSTNAMRDTIG